MSEVKGSSFQERQAAAARAKEALLAKFKSRPAPDDPEVMEREAKRRVIAEARATREAQRAAAKAEADAAARARKQAEEEARQLDLAREAERLEREKVEEAERKLELEAQKKLERDARYAARKNAQSSAQAGNSALSLIQGGSTPERRERTCCGGHCSGRRPVVFQHPENVFLRPGCAEEKALALRAPFGSQVFQVAFCFDAFRRNRHSQTGAERQNSSDNGLRVGFAADLMNERAIDLDFVEREAPQVAQRGIAGAEIVHGDANAERPQGVESR